MRASIGPCWPKASPRRPPVSERTLSVLDGSTFVLGDRLGDLRPDAGREHGFFSEDTRFVSRWVLRLDETPLELLSLNQSAHFDAPFFLTPADRKSTRLNSSHPSISYAVF